MIGVGRSNARTAEHTSRTTTSNGPVGTRSTRNQKVVTASSLLDWGLERDPTPRCHSPNKVLSLRGIGQDDKSNYPCSGATPNPHCFLVEGRRCRWLGFPTLPLKRPPSPNPLQSPPPPPRDGSFHIGVATPRHTTPHPDMHACMHQSKGEEGAA